MKIGVFDSGLGGLIITKAIRRKLPQYDYIYLGDTKRLPYGNRDKETIYKYATECIDYLFKHGCELIIVACNTVSVEALRRLQQEYLPEHYPNRRILGVVVPTMEAIAEKQFTRVGLIGTKATVTSNVYKKELQKIAPKITLFENATPLLVPFIEEQEIKLIEPILQHYLSPLMSKHVQVLILGCTHYCLLKPQVKKFLDKNTIIISQDAVIPAKLKTYLGRHPELDQKLTKHGTIRLLVTELTSVYKSLGKKWFAKTSALKKVNLTK
jgi:glutamate racemase